MRTTQLWTSDNSLYNFTNGASLDPKEGSISVEPSELRKRMIHIHRSTKEEVERSPTPTTAADYAAMKPHTIPRNDDSHITANSNMLYSILVASLCNNSSIRQSEGNNEWISVGDPTEVALLGAANQAGLTREYFLETLGLKKIFERAFDSERKMMSSVYSLKGQEDGEFVLCKGAPEELLSNCSHYAVASTDIKSMNREFLAENIPMSPVDDVFATHVSDENSAMAQKGLRVLGFAIKKVKSTGKTVLEDESAWKENNLVFLGLVGLIDPPKKGVSDSVAICQAAGVDVIMITGDHVETATAIATQLGIIRPNVPGMVCIEQKTLKVQDIY
jgi:P-type Ca2+ transporter type 2C